MQNMTLITYLQPLISRPPARHGCGRHNPPLCVDISRDSPCLRTKITRWLTKPRGQHLGDQKMKEHIHVPSEAPRRIHLGVSIRRVRKKLRHRAHNMGQRNPLHQSVQTCAPINWTHLSISRVMADPTAIDRSISQTSRYCLIPLHSRVHWRLYTPHRSYSAVSQRSQSRGRPVPTHVSTLLRNAH